MKEKQLFGILSHSEAETESAGALFATVVKESDFVALEGDLGAGKTAFVRGFASVLAPDAPVSSPSYSVINEYEGNGILICHMDVYRIESDDDLYSVGYYDYGNCITLVEWCEKTPQIIPEKYYRVRIEKLDEQTRMIYIYSVKNKK